MAQHKVIDLINQFMEDHGQSSGKDRVMLWLEDVYQKIRRLPWSWNFTTTETQTGGILYTTPVITSVITYDSAGAVVLADTETFTWTQGNDYIESTQSTVVCVNEAHTGRYVYISEEWYECVRIAPVGDTDNIYLDKKIVAASQAVDPITGLAKQMSFYRRDLAFKTNGIKSLHIDDQKIENLTDEQIYRFKRGLDPRWYYGDAGTPLAYHMDEKQVQEPQFAPAITVTSTTSGSATTGVHQCFWTFVDIETGQESAPGPVTEFTVTAGELIDIDYMVGGAHSADESTYRRRLYLTKAIDRYTRNPAFLLGTKLSASTFAVAYSLTDSTLAGNDSYYDGNWTRTVLYPAPDTYLRALSLHIDTWSGLPGEDETIKLGRQREFIELFHLYFLMKQSIQNKDPQQFRGMQGAFREQMNFLLGQDGDDRRLDPSSWEYRFFRPDTASILDSEFVASLKYPF
jgi:hypothetical protein